ncbi:MAG: sulfite exporter TauE/SafE family protein [Woeseiaceae bacterium]|nr:sulfite exporter TauE/SafE family protein [Woeseiaceae bacterium]
MGAAETWLVLAAAMAATGIVAGIMAGLFGIGGGIVIVPVLEFALATLGVDPTIRMHIAVSTSLATIIPTSISSARAHYRHDAVDFDIVRRWAAFVVIGALLGAFMASRVDSDVLAVIFATTAAFVAMKTLFRFGQTEVTQDIPRNPLVALLPTGIGAVSTMMGIGGGVLSVMVLRLFNQPIHRAIGTAALFGFAIAIPGTLGMIIAGWDDPRLPAGSLGFVSLLGFVAIAPMTVLAAPIGARLAHAFSEKVLSRLFAGFLIVASIRLFASVLA